MLLLTALSKRHTLRLLPFMSLASQQTPQEREQCPHPRCDVLARMTCPPAWQTLWTDPNIDSLKNFIRYYATDEELIYLLLPAVYHQSKNDHLVTRIPVAVWRWDCWVGLPQVERTTENCPRCTQGAGGFSWQWLSPRWTPEAALDLTHSHEDMCFQSVMPWPVGILRESQPALIDF